MEENDSRQTQGSSRLNVHYRREFTRRRSGLFNSAQLGKQNGATTLAKAAARSPEAGAEHQAPLAEVQPEDEHKALITAQSPLTQL